MAGQLAVVDVSVHFGGVKALDKVSVSVPDGHCVGIIGPNGSGKTTMLGAATRLIPIRSGSLSLDGHDYSRSSPASAARLGIGRTFQTVRLLESLDVIGNVMLGAAAASAERLPVLNLLRPARAVRENRRARADALEALARVGMQSHAQARPKDLPYGLQRRVEIARALATAPSLLLLDEPMAGMSLPDRNDIATLIEDLRADGLTLVLVEHDLAMIHRVCDSAIALDFGRVIASGPSREVAAQPVVREAYLGKESEDGVDDDTS